MARPRIYTAEERKARDQESTHRSVRKRVDALNEVGEIKPVRHPRVKARCATDLALFGWLYCRELLQHPPSQDMRDGLISDAQECILHGGQTVELYGRGGGKTTWVCIIAAIWAILYGYSRYVVCIGASMSAARKNLKTIKTLLSRSPALLVDFPGIMQCVQHIREISQRARNQTCGGEPTHMSWDVESITLPTVLGSDGQPLEAGMGGIIAVAGVGAAIRGANINGLRPDLVMLDDPQTHKDAVSATRVANILEFIKGDVLGLAGHTKAISCFVTITPQKPGDVAMELSNQDKYPEWSVKVQPFVKSFCPNWAQLVELYCAQFAADAAAKDYARPRSRKWYQDNAALFEGLEVIDPEQYDHEREVDARHHILNLRASLGDQAFRAEYLMEVTEAATALDLTADKVAGNVNGMPALRLPPGCDTVCGFCDVNMQAGAGLSWVLVAFGPRRVAAVIGYGRFPGNGEALVPKNASSTLVSRRVTAAIRAVVQQLAGLKIRDSKGRAVRIRAFGFDRGWLPEVVHRALHVIRKTLALGFSLVSMRGFPWDQFGRSKKDVLRRGDNVFATRSKYGEYLAVNTPYWREVQQSSWLSLPLTPGSLSVYGANPADHYRFAQEAVADKLVRKYLVYRGSEAVQAWDWQNTGPEHWGDSLTNTFALASWFRAYDSTASTIDEVALGVAQTDAQDAQNAQDAQDDEGTGVATAPQGDLETALEDGKSTAQYTTYRRKPAVRKRLAFGFKRGKYRK